MNKHWYEYAENPQAVHSVYSGDPALNQISVFAIGFDREGPSLQLRFDVDVFPDRPPDKWEGRRFNSAQFTVDFFGVINSRLDRWGTDNSGTIVVETDGTTSRVRVEGSNVNLQFACDTFRIARISGYSDAET